MAGWSRREVADDARLRMLLELGQVELAKAYLKAVEYRVTEEDDDAPGVTAEQVEQLRSLGLWRTLEELITKQMADRSRSRRARDKKRHVTTREDTRPNVSSREDTDITTRHPLNLEKKDEAPAAPPKSKPSKAERLKPYPEGWQPKDAHREKATELGVDVQHEAELFRSAALAKDYRYANWDFAFHGWLRRAYGWKQERGGEAKAAPPKAEPRAPAGALLYMKRLAAGEET